MSRQGDRAFGLIYVLVSRAGEATARPSSPVFPVSPGMVFSLAGNPSAFAPLVLSTPALSAPALAPPHSSTNTAAAASEVCGGPQKLDRGLRCIKTRHIFRGRVYDNIFIERLWRSVKYEEVFLHEYQTVAEAKKRLGEYFRFYNEERLHEALDYRTPSAVYFGTSASMMPTAAGMA